MSIAAQVEEQLADQGEQAEQPSEEEQLAEAQRRLLAAREAWEKEQAAAAVERQLHAGRSRQDSARGARGPARARPPAMLGGGLPPPRFRDRPLYAVAPPDTPSPATVEKRVREIIPPAFTGITWGTLATLRNEEGQPSLGAVEAHGGRTVRGSAAVEELRRRTTDARKVVLLGDTRAGKTIAGVAMLEAELRRGNDQARWVHADRLKEADTMARALASTFLLLDDLGWELKGALEGSGWLPTLRGPALEFLGDWYLKRTARLVVTTSMDYDVMCKLYGGGAAARVYEGAELIRLYPRP